jgi:hypothetical protein
MTDKKTIASVSWTGFPHLKADKVLTMEKKLIPAFIIDIDGTLSDPTHRLHYIRKYPQDWNSFFLASVDDPPHEYMLFLVKQLIHIGPIFLCTTRPEEYRTITIKWLQDHFTSFTYIYMRKPSDPTDNAATKLRMLNEIKSHGFQPLFAIDDQPSVVAMYRKEGIPCLAADSSTWVE